MIKKHIGIFATLICLMMLFSVNASAGESTTYSYTVSADGGWIKTQDAYTSGTVYLKDYGLSAPTDLFCFKTKLFVADTGNGRVVSYDVVSGEAKEIGSGILSGPMGIFVTETGEIYVADPAEETLFVFNADGTLKKRMERPNSYLIGEDSMYQPKNVCVSHNGNIFVVGVGAYEGIMQFSADGEFLGYFAANERKLTFAETVEDMLLTKEQKQSLTLRIPRSIENIDITDDDLIYSVTRFDSSDRDKKEKSIKLHNMVGTDILSSVGRKEEWNFVDISSGNHGNVYAVTETGLVYEYDRAGELLFSFGGRAVSNDRLGLFTKAAALDVDQSGVVYILDAERNLVQTFFPTEYAALTHRAVSLLNDGKYEGSRQVWSELLRLNGNARIAYIGTGRSLLYQQKYSESMKYFRAVGDHEYYSSAFWELRNQWIKKYMAVIIAAIALVVVWFYVNMFKNKQRKRRIAMGEPIPQKKKRLPAYMKNFAFSKMFLKNPADGYYYLKKGSYGSAVSATVLLFAEFLIFALDMTARGYLFAQFDITKLPPYTLLFMFFVPFALWVFGTYMVGAINDGEGTFRQIYCAAVYSLTPYLVITPFVIAASYILTEDEAFLVNFPAFIAVAWSVVLLIMSVLEIHNYTLKRTLKNVIIILFFMVLVVVAIAILYLIWTQVAVFIETVIGEVGYRVFS